MLMVFGCTILGAAAQILMKTGTHAVSSPNLLQLITNVPLMAGYALYGLSSCLMVLALRNGELSILYPIISLTYVWVSILSLFFFRESMNAYKILGLATIVAGVAVLGRGQRR